MTITASESARSIDHEALLKVVAVGVGVGETEALGDGEADGLIDVLGNGDGEALSLGPGLISAAGNQLGGLGAEATAEVATLIGNSNKPKVVTKVRKIFQLLDLGWFTSPA